MTVPVERTRAVTQTYEFLLDLLSPKATPRVPAEIRQRAARCIRHYPGNYDLTMAANGSPTVWGKPE